MPVSNSVISPNSAADIFIGITLSLCTVIGLPCNILAFFHFAKRPARNSNSLFFTRLYCGISLVDCLICAIQFPVVQSLFGGRDSSSLFFNNLVFCSIWTVLFMAVLTLSVFLVLMLSVARLLLIKFPHILMWPYVPCFMSLAYTTLIVMGLCLLPICTGYVDIAYNPNKGVCTMYGSTPGFSYQNVTDDTLMTKELLEADMAKKIAWSCIMALPLLPILVTFFMSLFYLKQAGTRRGCTHNAIKRHTDASLTVVIFTFVYVICNVPMLVYLAKLKSLTYKMMSTVNTGVPFKEEYDKLFLTMSDFERYYVWLLVFDLPTGLNSAFNPLIYYCRMLPFRTFIRSGIQDMTLQSNSDLRTELRSEPRADPQPDTSKSPVDIFKTPKAADLFPITRSSIVKNRTHAFNTITKKDDVEKQRAQAPPDNAGDTPLHDIIPLESGKRVNWQIPTEASANLC